VIDLFVANIDFAASEADVRALFETVGVVSRVRLIFTPDGESRGFGFVTMYDDDADSARQLDGLNFRGRRLKVDLARPRADARA
jgi:RNA recognition motif-containing protein